MAISREAVSWGFRLILGREPESEEGILAHMRLDDETELIEVLLRSGEFRNSKRFDKLIQLREGVTAERSTPWPYQSTCKLRMALFGNCQVVGVGRLLQAMSGDISVQTFETTPTMLDRLQRGDLDIAKTLRSADLVFVQYLGQVISIIQERFPKHAHKLRQFPPVAYAGFHPDCVYVRSGSGHLSGSMGEYHSAIAFWAWRHGLDVRHAVDLFRPEVFEALGYDSYHQAAYNSLIEIGRDTSMPMAPHLDTWQRHGCWMHTINHPKLMVLADVASAMLVREGIEPIREAAQWVEDPLLNWPVWPVYPGLAEKVGLQGSYVFKIDSGFCPPQRPVLTMDLESFVEASYNTYKRSDRTRLSCPRVDTPPYSKLPSLVREQPSRLQVLARALVRVATPTAQPTASGHPYQALPDFAYWRRSVERVAAELIDPVIEPKFAVTISDRVATAGSCFAQHIARTLQREGFNYFVADDDQGLTAEQRQRRGYGVFSARYGNVYTTRQLVQLFDRAHGDFRPAERAWLRPDGRFVDPFRPQVEPDGFASEEAVEEATKAHMADVRRMFAELDVFVFTLGLTEAWRLRADGAVYPLCPGVVAGRYDQQAHEFINLGVAEVEADLRGFVARLRSVNPRARSLLTVSPVPLVASQEPSHVLVSNAQSKAVLRAAAGSVARGLSSVDYFPSFEIITGAHARGAYFEADLRSVTEQGVAHVMRVFMAHYGGRTGPTALVGAEVATAVMEEQRQLRNTVCDEEALDRHQH